MNNCLLIEKAFSYLQINNKFNQNHQRQTTLIILGGVGSVFRRGRHAV